MRLNWKQLVAHKYLKIKEKNLIPLTFETNEETGELLPITQHNESISDVISLTGSVVHMSSRNEIPYKQFY